MGGKARPLPELDTKAVVGCWTWAVERNLVFADALVADFFSVDPARARKGAPFDVFLAGIHEDDQVGLSSAVRAALAINGPFRQSYRVRTHSFGMRRVIAAGHAFRDAEGHRVFSGYIADVTEDRSEGNSALRHILAARALLPRDDPAINYLMEVLLQNVDASDA